MVVYRENKKMSVCSLIYVSSIYSSPAEFRGSARRTSAPRTMLFPRLISPVCLQTLRDSSEFQVSFLGIHGWKLELVSDYKPESLMSIGFHHKLVKKNKNVISIHTQTAKLIFRHNSNLALYFRNSVTGKHVFLLAKLAEAWVER